MNLKKIPVTVVTGFLGSGKTTLLRHVLQQAKQRIAVIVNEFGELGIDGEILKNCPVDCDFPLPVEDRIVELANGCICCTVQDEFYPVMEQLLKNKHRIDHIIIETSGLALPKPLVQAFNWPTIKPHCTVDAVITVVDGPAVLQQQFAHDPAAVAQQRTADLSLNHHAELRELFLDQLTVADLVIINKMDLLTADQHQTVTMLIRDQLPPEVKTLAASYGKLDLNVVLGLNKAAETAIHTRQTLHELENPAEHDHDAFTSLSVRLPVVDEQRLMTALQTLVAEFLIFRVKGFVAVPQKPLRMVLQGVGTRFTHFYDRAWHKEELVQTQIVIIGFQLDAVAVEHRLKQLLN